MFRFVSQKISMNPEITNIIGYAASFFIVLSFVLKDIRKIRIVNLVGCICFVIYGIFSDYLWPIIIPNAILCGVQVYHLVKKA
ncbi:hypothetical protein SAMN05421638_1433 [Kaistella treverensis]|uniref:Uroporphyrinogen decarboxylase n=2 Tax=Kaistella TaxID=2782231 RepID=A0A1I3LZB0_9FLAO|nr:hypothetical protein SAMN05421638_1433 [Kaistella treverensis]